MLLKVVTLSRDGKEATRLARTETRHGFLAHGDLLRVSLYGRQGRDSVLGPQYMTSSILKFVIIKAV